MANICRSLRKIFFSFPVLKSPTHIGFIDVIKNGSKISHLGTFKWMIGLELNHALVISLITVEAAHRRHADPPVLRQGLSLRGEGVPDNKLV